MLKSIVLAAMITSGAAAAYAQTTQKAPQQAASPSAATTTTGTAAPMASADTRKLIGRDIKNAQNETIGEIKSIYIGKDGKVDSVMVGVGGFLGVGEREVRLAWQDLTVSENGEKVTVNMSKDELKAKPEYKYGDPSWRGQVFTDRGPWKADDRPNVAAAPATSNSYGDFNAEGHASGSAIVGAKVRNENRETVGEVEEIYIDKDGAVKAIIVSVGGFLGMGDKDVAVKWTDVKVARDGNDLIIMTNWTKDSLKAMPEYKKERPASPTRSGG